jgi:hypothetical protein
VKVNLIARDPVTNNLVAVEVKTGPKAKMNSNQMSGYRALRATGGVPRGGNASAAGLTVGEQLGPVEVVEVAVPDVVVAPDVVAPDVIG